MGPYCATKAAVSMFSDSLRAEVKQYGVKVIDVMPGRIHTGFSSRVLGCRKSPSTPHVGANPHDFARKLFKAYKRKSRKLVYPALYFLFLWFTRTFPGFYDKAAIKVWKLDE